MANGLIHHRFVESVPENMEASILYVALDFSTMIHLCACGCGQEVVTQLSSKDWNFTYDGETISVSPSIGNWSSPCRSHYFIRRGEIKWAGDWSDEKIEKGRQNDLLRKRPNGMIHLESQKSYVVAANETVSTNIIVRILRKLFRR